MLTESTYGAVRRSAQVEVGELRQRTITWISVGLAVLGFLATWLGPAKHLTGRFAIYLSLLIEGIVAAYACSRRPFLARAVLLVGPTLSLGRAIVLLDGPLLPSLAVLIVLANAAISIRSGVLSAILNTVMLCVLTPFDSSLASALALVWLSVAIQWISFSGMRTALDWLWHSQEQVQKLIDELRDRQGVLNRTLRSLDEANARMVAANERMAETRRQADEARQAKARFAANVSHELRTPLNIIVGFTEVMYNSPPTPAGSCGRRP
jgi:signal transduction histidine kinase